MVRLLQIFFLLFLFSHSSFAAPLQSNFIVAKVNNKVITNLELLDRYHFVLVVSKISIKSEEDKKLLFDQILDKMVDEELIRQESQNLKLEVSENEMRDAIEIMALQQKKNATQFKLFFIKNNLSFDNYLKQVESELLWSKIISETLRSKVKITDVEVKEFFEQQKFNTNVKKLHIAEILISQSLTAEKLAQKLVLELRKGADFKNIVKQFSQSISAENDGELGWVLHNDIDAKIFEAISKLGKGDYSDPILLSDGYHIFKLLDLRIENKIADPDLAAARNAIFVRKLQTVAKGYLMDLRKKSFVEKV
jgi:peptidyl-prolyl cis-trans isomerase SurA